MKKWKKSEQRLSESGKKLIQFVEACLLNSLQRSKGTYVSAFLLLRIFFHWGGRRIVCNGNKGDDENKDWIGRKRERQQSMSASNFFECFYEKERESERERGRVTEIKCTSNSVTKNLLYLRIVPKWQKVVPFQESHAKSCSILGYFFPNIWSHWCSCSCHRHRRIDDFCSFSYSSGWCCKTFLEDFSLTEPIKNRQWTVFRYLFALKWHCFAFLCKIRRQSISFESLSLWNLDSLPKKWFDNIDHCDQIWSEFRHFGKK